MTANTTPHPVDLHVGRAIRTRRKLIGISQNALADDLGLTFQQVQKYERGTNRVSASKLFQIAGLLDTTVATFFDGLKHDNQPLSADIGHASAVIDLLGEQGGLQLARAYLDLPPKLRLKVISIACTLVDEPDQVAA